MRKLGLRALSRCARALAEQAGIQFCGPAGQLPSIEQVMPWLHLVFDAYEDYKRSRAREAAERAAHEAAEHHDEPDDDDGDDRHRKDKKNKKHKDKD